MLFTTTTFAFLFLPLALLGFYLAGRWSAGAAMLWLLVASLVFYAYWMPWLTLLLLLSMAMNFHLGRELAERAASARATRTVLILGLVFNLGLLGYFKYANFFVDNLNALLGTGLRVAEVVLPVGISFYTFTQIAFLVDSYQGKVREARPTHYGLFVTYFPHLVAGPVLHHAQMMPQFASPGVVRWQWANVVSGLALFALGLWKKVVLADGVAPYADAVFNPVDAQKIVPSTAEAWLGAVAYTFQLYFDFSAYSDMAVGLSWMFNIRLPFNFDSPYRATNISDFWRRWHISLSTFLRDYLYVPLGGNRRGVARRYINLWLTMVLGGLWHGASWSFVLWGALHGMYLMLNHGFRALVKRSGGWASRLCEGKCFALCAWALTLLSVIVAWVFFRATTLDGALRLVGAMVGLQGSALPGLLLWNAGLSEGVGWGWCVALGAVACLLPNSNSWVSLFREQCQRSSRMCAIWLGVSLMSVLVLIVLNQSRDAVSAFIYFNF